jgi:hypothetical protein
LDGASGRDIIGQLAFGETGFAKAALAGDGAVVGAGFRNYNPTATPDVTRKILVARVLLA